jgi:2-haloacid dehalogenase
MDAAGIRVCVFDAYGTLLDVGAMAADFAPALGGRCAAFMRRWRARQLEISWLPSPMVAGADFWLVTAEALDETMAAFGLDDMQLRNQLMQAWLRPRCYADATAMMTRLTAAGIKCAILSNGTRRMLEDGIGSLPIAGLLDTVLSAEAAGVFKPNPAVYKLVTDHYQLDAKRVCFVSGNNWDITGAASFGFNTVWINRTGELPDELPRGTWASVTSLADLPALLGA